MLYPPAFPAAFASSNFFVLFLQQSRLAVMPAWNCFRRSNRLIPFCI